MGEKSSILQMILDGTHDRHSDNLAGSLADYIPELGRVDPDQFGLAIVTANGDVFTSGDADEPFTIQSLSKPFAFGMALEHWGAQRTYEHVGTEPSGDAFNAIVLDPQTGLPYNPMVNAGAIAMTSLLHEAYGDDAFAAIKKEFGDFAGAELEVDEAVCASEIATAHRNRAVAHLMRNNDVIGDPVEDIVSLYTRQCSITVTARSLATMAATLANVGTNPITDKTVASPLTVRHVLSVMFSCGMYDYAGRWGVDVGLPAKSGVCGGVFAVVNRQIGIGLYSPLLDDHGNSVRGIKACIDLAEELGLHTFEFTNAGSAVLDVYL